MTKTSLSVVRVSDPSDPAWAETDNPADQRRKNPRKTCKRLVVNRVAVLVSTLCHAV